MTLCVLPAGQPGDGRRRATAASDSLAIGPHTRLVFADRSQAQQILMRRDRFVEQMTGLDRQLRLRDRQDPTEADYLRFLGENAQDWSAVEMAAVRAALGPVTAKLAEFPRIWPPHDPAGEDDIGRRRRCAALPPGSDRAARTSLAAGRRAPATDPGP